MQPVSLPSLSITLPFTEIKPSLEVSTASHSTIRFASLPLSYFTLARTGRTTFSALSSTSIGSKGATKPITFASSRSSFASVNCAILVAISSSLALDKS